MSVNQLDETDLIIDISQTITKMGSITGAIIPMNKELLKSLIDELILFLLNFDYGDLTIEEILLATRLNAIGVVYADGEYAEQINLVGVQLNVTSLAKILKIYKVVRNSMQRKIENQIDGYEL